MSAALDHLGRTALTPYWARVRDREQREPILADSAAASLAPLVAANLGIVPVSDSTRIGCCLRNRAVDRWVRQLVADHRLGAVIDIGVGLDTRLLRLPDLDVRYVEVDRPAVIGLRNQWMTGTGAIRIPGDGMQVLDWLPKADVTGPVAIVLEGVLAYQAPSTVDRFLHDLAAFLPGAFVLFDSLSPLAAWPANRPQALASGRPRYEWTCWSTKGLVLRPERWTILQEAGLMDTTSSLAEALSRGGRMAYSLPPMRRSYRLTLAQLPGGSHGPE